MREVYIIFQLYWKQKYEESHSVQHTLKYNWLKFKPSSLNKTRDIVLQIYKTTKNDEIATWQNEQAKVGE